MVFETKKLNIETLSEYLVKVRADFKLPIEEVAKRTGIQQKFLENLEQGKYAGLPPDVYVLGFLRQLGQLYAVDSALLIGQFKKERAIDQSLTKQTTYENVQARKYLGRVMITPKILGLAFGGAFVTLTVAYIIWQVFSINRTPTLEILQPRDREVILRSSVSVLGKTEPGTTLSLNDQSIFVDNQGNFKTQVGVEQGPKELVFVATNKFGKSITKTITVTGQAQGAKPENPGVRLQVGFSGTVNLIIAADDAPEQELAFHAGDKKTFTAISRLMLSTSDAGATSVVLNDMDMGALGRPGEKLSQILFTPAASPGRQQP